MYDEMDDEPGAQVAFHLIARMARLLRWIMFIGVHLAAWLLVLTALWAFDISARNLLDWLIAISASAPVAFASAFGLSGLGVMAAYWRAATWIARKAHHGWMWRYLTKGLAKAG